MRILGCVFCLLMTGLPVRAATHFVAATSTNPVSPFATWETAAATIQDAIDAAGPNDVVLVSNGVYSTGGRVVHGSMTNRVVITNAITLASVNGAAVTTIRGGGPKGDRAVRCVFAGPGAIVSGFTLEGGATRTAGDGLFEQRGGGAWCDAAVIVSNCTFVGNSAGSGGGAYGGVFSRCLFISNAVSAAGGALCGAEASDCSFTRNSAISGGAVSSGTVFRSLVVSNMGTWGGGAQAAIVHNSLLTRNSSVNGGAASDSCLYNCTLLANEAQRYGGVYNCTALNSIVYYSSAVLSAPDYSGGSFNACCLPVLPPAGEGNFTNAPGVLAYGDPRLTESSPCVDAGSNAFCFTALDLEAGARTNGPAVDVGCVEFTPGICTGALAVAILLPMGTYVVEGYKVNFQAQVTGRPLEFWWRFDGDPALAGAFSVDQAFAGEGDHTVVLSATNADAFAAATVTVHVVANSRDLLWSGGQSSWWDAGLSLNWNTNTTAFYQGDTVAFDDTAISRTVQLAGPLAPEALRVNATMDYSFGGAGSLTGPMSLTKSGSGVLTVGTANSYDGTTVVSGGTFRATASSALGSALGGTIISGGATLDTAGNTIADHLAVIGTGVGGNGSIVNNGAPSLSGPLRVTLVGDASVGGASRFDLRGGPDEFLDLAGNTLTKVGMNQFSLVGVTVTNAGNLVANQGVLSLEVGALIAGPGSIIINSNATLQYWRDPTILKPVVMNAGTIYCYSVSSTAGATHVINKNCSIRTDSDLWITHGLTGPAGFVKRGGGGLYLTASNSAAGGMTVAEGAVVLNAGASFSSTITNNSLVGFADTNAIRVTWPLSIVGSGIVDLNTPEGMTLEGTAHVAVSGGLRVAESVGSRLIIGPGARFTANRVVLGGGNGGWPGHLVQSGGVVVITGQLGVGSAVNETSTYFLSSGSLFVTNAAAGPGYQPGDGVLCIGVDGTGRFTMTGGLVQCSGLVLDGHGDTTGTDAFTLEAGTLRLGPWGMEGNPSAVVQLGGGLVTAARPWTATLPITLTGTNGATVFDTAEWAISLAGPLSGPGGLMKIGTGVLSLASAANTFSGGTTVAEGTLQLQAPGSEGQGALPPGRPVTVSAGAALRLAATEALGIRDGGPSLLALESATLTVSPGLHVSVGTVALDGATMTSEGAGDASGNFILDGPILSLANPQVSVLSAHRVMLRGGSNAPPVEFRVERGSLPVDLQVTAAVFGSGGLNKTGPGIAELRGAGTYEGETTISNGVLLVNGSTGTGLVRVADGGTLGGTGRIDGSVLSAGTVTPGLPFGTLGLAQDYQQTASGVLNIRIAGAASPALRARLDVGQSATLSGTLNIAFTNGFLPSSNDVFAIVVASSVAGSFTTVNLGGAGGDWDLRYTGNAVLLLNTNAAPPAAPVLQCPPDVRLPVLAPQVPPPAPSDCIALVTCGSVTVAWTGDTTNSGTGCRGDPKIITRGYRAVSSCGATSDCAQLFILEDTTPPAITTAIAAARNGGFEEGSLLGWTASGPTTNFSVRSADPRGGWFHLVMDAPYGLAVLDSGPGGFNGVCSGGVLRGQSPATTSLGFSASFDGVDDFVDLPALHLGASNATIAAWVKRNASQIPYAGVVFARGTGTDVSGLNFSTGNQLGYYWNSTANTYGWLSGLVPPDGQWVYVALAVSPSNAVLYMHSTNGWTAATNPVSHGMAAFDGNLHLGRDSSGSRRFKGGLNDVQVYNRALSFAEIVGLWNGGAGNATTAGLAGRWKLDEPFLPAQQSFIQQDLPAARGQVWSGVVWAKVSPNAPLGGTNQVSAALQFLNATDGILTNVMPAVKITSATAPGAYTRMLARGTAPSNTAKARLRITYQQDAAGSTGTVLCDDIQFTDVMLPTGVNINQCGTLPNYRTNGLVSALDDSSGTNVTWVQYPPAASSITSAPITVTMVAADACGNTNAVSFDVFVDDATTPLAAQVIPASTNFQCAVAPFTNSYLVLDNCAGWTASMIGAQTNSGSGCPGNPRVTTNTYRITDIGGNSRTALQVVSVVDTLAPVGTLRAPELADAGFEGGSFPTNWTAFGAASVAAEQPHGGSFHARLEGQTNTLVNDNGLQQDLPAQEGQAWRLAAWVLTPSNEPIGGENLLAADLAFCGAATNILATRRAEFPAARLAPAGVYRPISVSAVAPTGTVFVRGVFTYARTGGAPGAVFVDDTSLSRTAHSAANACSAALGGLTDLLDATDNCSAAVVTQAPPAGVSLGLGTNVVRLYARDACGNTSTAAVNVVVVDDLPPAILSRPPDLVVPDIMDVPAPDPAAVVAADACGGVSVTNLPDVGNGGAGTTNDALVIARAYVASDAWGNLTQVVQIITVGGIPPAGYDLFATRIPDSGLRGPRGDPDGDGYANLLEYVTGGDPTNSDQTARMNGGRTNGVLTLRFTRATNSVDATLHVEGSFAATNNAGWAGIATNAGGVWAGPATVTEGGGNPASVTVQDTSPAATNRFLRLRVTRP